MWFCLANFVHTPSLYRDEILAQDSSFSFITKVSAIWKSALLHDISNIPVS